MGDIAFASLLRELCADLNLEMNQIKQSGPGLYEAAIGHEGSMDVFVCHNPQYAEPAITVFYKISGLNIASIIVEYITKNYTKYNQ